MLTSISTELAEMHCSNCFIAYAIPRDMYTTRMQNGRNFYCPNGHVQHYNVKKMRREERADERKARGLRQDRILALHDEEQAEAKRAEGSAEA